MLHRAPFLYAVPLLLQLTACGGGGSSDTPAPITPAATPALPATAVVGVSSLTPDGAYSAGHSVDIAVKFQHPVTVTGGIPTLELDTRQADLGTTDAALSTPPMATYISGSGSNTLVFRYAIQAADRSADLDYRSTTSLALNGAQIRDTGDLPVNAALPAPGAAASLKQAANLRIINWSNPHEVATGLFTLPATPTFTTTAGNTLSLAYQQISAGHSELRAVLTEASTGANLASLVLANMDSTAQFSDATAYMLGDGSALVFWAIRSTTTNFQNLYTCHFRVDGTCSTVVDLGNKPTLASDLHPGRERGGQVHLLWVGNGLNDSFFDTATESWSPVRSLVASDPMFDAKYLEDAQGNWTVIWPQPGSYHQTALRFSNATRSWSAAKAIESLTGFAKAPSVLMDPDGNIAVLWEQRWSTPTTGIGRMAAANLDAATGVWTTADFISASPSPSFKSYQLARNSEVNVAAWNEQGHFYTADYSHHDKTWSSPVVVDGGLTIEGAPAVRPDADGGRAILWFTRQPTGRYTLYGRYFSPVLKQWGSPVRLKEEVLGGGLLPVADDGVMSWIQRSPASVYSRWEIGID